MEEKLTALVVDDEKLIQELLATVLQLRGYTVRTASDGQEGVESFREQRCDLVMLDIQMPRMDGLEALRHIRALDAHVGLIIMTGAGGDSEREEAGRFGAAFVKKPFSIPDLETLWEQVEQERLRWRAAGRTENSDSESHTSMGSVSDRRCHGRAAVNIPAAVMERRGNGSQARSCEIRDISLGGSRNRFSLDPPFPAGTDVHLSFPAGNPQGRVAFPGTVVWSDAAARHCGAQFHELNDQQRMALENVVVAEWRNGRIANSE